MPKELNLNSNVEVLVVTIGEKKYNVPLASDLPYKKTKPLLKLANKWKNLDVEKEMDSDTLDETLDVFFDFFKQYIPLEVLEELSTKALSVLANSWVNANDNKAEDGQTLGE